MIVSYLEQGHVRACMWVAGLAWVVYGLFDRAVQSTQRVGDDVRMCVAILRSVRWWHGGVEAR